MYITNAESVLFVVYRIYGLSLLAICILYVKSKAEETKIITPPRLQGSADVQ
jgi:hypothetical protein